MKKLTAGLTAVAMLAFATPASAAMNLSGVFIGAENQGAIVNVTTATANTGGNEAGGSRGGNGGRGGDVEAEGNGPSAGNNKGADAGNGGNGGNASAGGLVETGDANADAGSVNKLNDNDVSVSNKGGMNLSLLGVGATNAGVIVDITGAGADSGNNDARGSRGGRGGSGGDVEADSNNANAGDNQWADGGHGGSGGAGGIGGEVRTGEANSNAGSINVMNTNVVRVRN